MNNFCVNTYDCSLPIETMTFSEGIGASSKELEEYEFEVNENDLSFLLASMVEKPLRFGSCNFSIDGKYLRGHWILLRAELSCQNVCGWSGLWMRIDGKSSKNLAFDNMNNRSLSGTIRSKTGFISMFVPKNAEKIQIGLVLCGTGKIQSKELELLTSKAPRSRGILFKSIPADCYRLIVDYLDSVCDFLSFSMVCRYTRNSLILNNEKSYYHLKFQLKDISLLVKNYSDRKLRFVEFMSMNFNDVTLPNLKKLKEIFPNLHTLQMDEIGSRRFYRSYDDPVARVIKHENLEILEKIIPNMFNRIIDPEQSDFLKYLKSIDFFDFRKLDEAMKLYGDHNSADFPNLPIKTLIEYVKNESEHLSLSVVSNKYGPTKSEKLICSLIYKLFMLKDTKKAVEYFEKLLTLNRSTWTSSAYAIYLECVIGDDRNLVRIEKLHRDASKLEFEFNILDHVPCHEGFTKYKESGHAFSYH